MSMRARRGLLSAFLLLSLGACAAVPMHQPVPEEFVSTATISGFLPDIRFWADEAPKQQAQIIARRIDEYRKDNDAYFREHGSYPPLNYLAISGGAYDGAYGAGLLSGWSATGRRPEFALVTGVSTGALIAPFAFAGPKYDATLRELFTKSDSAAIFETDVWRLLEGVAGGLALTDNKPLAKKISEHVTQELIEEIAAQHRRGRRLFIGTTHIEAQRGMIWDIGAIAASGNPQSLELIQRIMLASSSIPGLFQPVFFEVEAQGRRYSEIHVDGGVTSQVFAYPIRLSREVIDVFERYRLERRLYIIRNSKVSPEYQPIEPGVFSISGRSAETLIKYQGIGDLYRLYAVTQRDNVDYYLATIPPTFNNKSRELFDPAYMSALFDVGYAQGRAQDMWMRKPPGIEYLRAKP